MTISAGKIVREIGTALAVLAIYVLTMLAPLHQAAGLQRDLAALGFDAIGVWSVCAPLTEADGAGGKDVLQIKCPAAGIGKNELAAILPAQPAAFGPLPAFEPVIFAPDFKTVFTRPVEHPRQPRAPPVQA